MNDMAYEFQRMVSRQSEIREATKSHGVQAAWVQYSREHGLDLQRFRNDLPQLRTRFNGIASGRE